MATTEQGRDDAPTLLERAGTAAAGIGQVKPRHPAVRIAIQWGIPVLIFASLVFFVIRQWSDLPDFDWHFKPVWLVVSAPAVLMFYFAQGEIWRLIIHALGEEHLRPKPARAIWGKSLIARYVPTNALMVVGRLVMAEREGVPKRVCLASIVYELGLGFGTAVMVGAYFVIQLPDLEGQPARYAVMALIPLVLAVLHPRVFFPLANYGLRKLGREPLEKALPFRRILEFCVMYIGCWIAIGVGVFAFAKALTTIQAGDLPYIASAYPVAFCVAVLTFIAPGGLGVRDAALAISLKAVVPSTVATAIAVAFRIFQTGIELVYVAIVVWMARREQSKLTAARRTASAVRRAP